MERKSFAFKLAEKKAHGPASGSGKWRARDGVSLAACTELPNGNYRNNELWFPNGPPTPEDKGYFC